jgi:putative ABC transport system substrate-binding protein
VSTRRRLLVAVCAVPLLSRLPGVQAQTSSSIRRVGILSAGSRETTRYLYAGFEAGLRELGYIEGKNLMLDYRFADGKFDRLPALAAEFAQRKPDVLLAQSTPSVAAAKAAITEIPVVMVGVADPVGAGLVSNLARPGGNITGFTNISADLAGKRLAILKEIVPRLSRVAVIFNPDDPNARIQMTNVEEAAQLLGIQLSPVLALHKADDLASVFAAAAKARTAAAIRMVDPLVTSLRKGFVDQAAKHKLPVIYPFREDVEAGGLISYGASLVDQFRRAATYVDKILKGTKPGDLPVEQPTKFELVINRKTAHSLGLTIPQSLLVSADRVIE